MKKLSRRTALAGLGSLGAAVPALAEAGADAELIALGKQLDRLDAERKTILVAIPDDPTLDQDYVWRDYGAWDDRAHDAVTRVIAIAPAGLAGLAVVAKAVSLRLRWWHSQNDGTPYRDTEEHVDDTGIIVKMLTDHMLRLLPS